MSEHTSDLAHEIFTAIAEREWHDDRSGEPQRDGGGEVKESLQTHVQVAVKEVLENPSLGAGFDTLQLDVAQIISSAGQHGFIDTRQAQLIAASPIETQKRICEGLHSLLAAISHWRTGVSTAFLPSV